MGICRSCLRFCRDCLSSVLDEEDEEQQEERDIHEEQGSVGVGHLQNNYENYVNPSFSRDEQNYAIANSLSDQDDEYVEVQPQNDNIYVALLDYSTGQAGHLSFSKGEKFQIIKEFPNDLCQVRNIGPGPSGRVGLLSKSHLAKDESFNDNPWYHGNISKTDVQRLLLSPSSLNGSFLVRNSETRHDQFVLAVRETSSTPELKYYPIHEVNSEYFLSSSDRRFKTLSTFVQYYQTADQRDLPTRLTSPITKYEQIPAQRPFQIVHRKWEIDRKHLRMGNEIGSGQFGIVYRAKWKGNQDVAVKTLKTDLMDKSEFLKEAEAMKDLNHPKLVMLYGVCTSTQPFYIITEFMCHGNLKNFLSSGKGKNLNTTSLIQLAVQVADGMSYLESKNYVHRDLAARNVLVDEENNCKIADFGLSRLTQDDRYLPRNANVEIKLPVKWTAPEAYFQELFTSKSDVWSFGILLSEIIGKGERPFPDKDGRNLQEELRRGYRMPQPGHCPDDLYVIMVMCWMADPEERPRFGDLQRSLDSLHYEGRLREIYAEDDRG